MLLGLQVCTLQVTSPFASSFQNDPIGRGLLLSMQLLTSLIKFDVQFEKLPNLADWQTLKDAE